MKTTASLIAVLTALGGAALAQTGDGTDDQTATTPQAAGSADPAAEGGDAATPLILPGEEEAAEGGAAADTTTDASETDVIETDVESTGEAMQMDGTVPVDASPTPSDAEEGADAEATEGGAAAGAAAAPSADVSTDATASGESMEMDGTVPVDESPEAGGGASTGEATND